MCVAQGHNTVTPVRLKPGVPQSRVKHSTTEPLCSLMKCCLMQHFIWVCTVCKVPLYRYPEWKGLKMSYTILCMFFLWKVSHKKTKSWRKKTETNNTAIFYHKKRHVAHIQFTNSTVASNSKQLSSGIFFFHKILFITWHPVWEWYNPHAIKSINH